MPAKLSIKDARVAAAAHGGKCHSVVYVGNKEHLQWECEKGHLWSTSLFSVRRGYWCPHCAGVARYSIEDMRRIASEHNGQCLSTSYCNIRDRLEWQCAEGHKWKTEAHNVTSGGNWCPDCGREKATASARKFSAIYLGQMRKIAEERGGRCLSAEYVNQRSHLQWQCAKGHIWSTSPSNVKDNGTWCPTCSGSLPLGLEHAKNLAIEKGGKLLSSTYKNNSTKMQWKCSNGHEWVATVNHIKDSQSWCPHCRNKTEQVCRDVFEKLTGRRFPKCKPSWLQRLELDGYCEELGLAFEYNGEQHYKIIPGWHPNGQQDLEDQQERDARKELLCDDNWVYLIIIPFTVDDKEAFIRQELELLGLA